MAKKSLSITQEDWDEPYAPVVCHPQAELIHELKNPAFKQAYDALTEEYDTVDKVLKARKHANMTRKLLNVWGQPRVQSLV